VVHNAFAQVNRTLLQTRSNVERVEWESCVEFCRAHELGRILHADPFIGRSFNKPRGYPGDAELLDMIYDYPHIEGQIDEPVTRAIFRYGIHTSAPRAVRARRDFFAQQLLELRNAPQARVLSVACGHLREMDDLQGSLPFELVGLDHDPVTLVAVRARCSDPKLALVEMSVLELMKQSTEIGDFDLIYTGGLYDYFSDKLARKLTQSLLGRLRPGGRLIIANLTPDIPDIGFMECYMDWWMYYRTSESMLELAAQVGLSSDQQVSVASDQATPVCYLTIHQHSEIVPAWHVKRSPARSAIEKT
jgi:extracellular factor (EF) 3-hydroxypalmitic acid methyl ester biosynthesis protein